MRPKPLIAMRIVMSELPKVRNYIGRLQIILRKHDNNMTKV
ncbi:hypothetical protein IMCC1989_2504 [gamma proteobacterium IMCC1989]|nr:hypothetical protein IMCC1989_2504 [gamma proteobacterium IMCC1989]